jgi:hypothetical protein
MEQTMARHPPAAKVTLPARPAPLPKIDQSGVHPAAAYPAAPKPPKPDEAPASAVFDRSLLDSRAGGQPPVDTGAMHGAQAGPAAGHAAAAHPTVHPAMLPAPRAVPSFEPND